MTAVRGELETAVQTGDGKTGITRDSSAAAKKSTRARSTAQARGAARPRSEVELLAEISTKLDRVVAVLAAQGKGRDTQVAILAAANCDSAFIGTLLGMSAGAVRNLPGWRRAQGVSGSDPSEEPA